MTTPLVAGRELDALVGEKVMGYRWARFDYPPAGWRSPNGQSLAPWRWLIHPDVWDERREAAKGDESRYIDNVQHFSTDIAAAMGVVAEVQRRNPGWRFSLLGGDSGFGYFGSPQGGVDRSQMFPFGWRAQFFGHHDPDLDDGTAHGEGEAETAPLAICLAALDAIESAESA